MLCLLVRLEMPRKRKSFGRKTCARSSSAPAILCRTNNSPRKRKRWTDEQMVAAITAVKNGMLIKRAAEEHGVPTTTLRDRINGSVVHGTKPGPKPYLSKSEEGELKSFLKTCTDIGYGKTRRDVMCIVQSVAIDKGVLKSQKITEGWWRRFLQRQPDLSLRRGDTTAHVRMNAVNKKTMEQYISLLNDVLDEHELHTKPSQIYNVDESGIPFDPRPPNIVATKGTKKVRYRASGRKGQVTIVGCASASGHAIPPMVIFDAQKLNPAWTEGEFPGTKYGLSKNGWINSELFEAWLSEHFLEHTVSSRPLLLLLDGHSTHYQPELLRVAKDHDVIMLCLPPHTTHESQPLDCGVFGPLKSHWSNVCHTYLQQNPGRIMNRFQFSALFSKAWGTAVSPSNIIAGFRRCGVYPFNPSAISVPDVPDANDDEECSEAPSHHTLPSDIGINHPSTHYVTSSSSSLDMSQSVSKKDASNSVVDGASVCVAPSISAGSKPSVDVFTPEQLRRFQIRYEEGFNVYTDPDYVKWLELYHPESLPSDRYALIPAEIVTTEFSTLADHFSSVVPMVSFECTEVLPVATRSSNEETSQADSPVSKYLTLPAGATPSIPRTLPRARLLASSDALAQLEEKERKKKSALEEKERRKAEREDKKRQKEEEQKRKAQEKEKKAKEKAKRAKEAANKKGKKKASKPSELVVSADSGQEGNSSSSCEPPSKKPRRPVRQAFADSQIDEDTCCICFGSYSEDVVDGDGRERIKCECGRWLHEDCADDRIVDSNGKERFCHHCIELYV